MKRPRLSREFLNVDPGSEAGKIEKWVRDTVVETFRKRGVVIGLSGGIDSSVCAAICVNALGRENVLGLFTPETEGEEETNHHGRVIAEHLGVETIREDITKVLEEAGCYRRRNQGIRMTIPEFKDEWGSKVILPEMKDGGRLNVSSIVVRDGSGDFKQKRMKTRSYLQVVASSNFKQRTRKMMEYYHAERLNYAVVGTPNKLEYDLGFFVKYGDGAADIKPISHLYKTQVYQLGRQYGLPAEILDRRPTTDTYSLPQTQEEFYFTLPYGDMDLALYAYDNGYSEMELSEAMGISSQQAEGIYQDIKNKKRIANFLHTPPLVLK